MRTEEVGRLLAKSNTAVQHRFLDVAQELVSQIGERDLEDWGQICLDISDAGWHGHEATLSYLDLSLAVLRDAGVERLHAIGRYGRALSSYSFVPSKAYFGGYLALLRAGGVGVGTDIERAGSRVYEMHPRASGLIADFFSVAFHMAATRDQADARAWLDTSQRFLTERGVLGRYVELSRTSDSVPWCFVGELSAVTSTGSISYLEHYADLERSCPGDFLEDLQPLILKYLRGPHAVSQWYEALIRLPLTGTDGRGLIALLENVDDVRLATCLVGSSAVLPLDKHGIMQSWVAEGTVVAERSFEAGEAFFSLESAQSQNLLSVLEGQVELAECKRVLQLFTEAFCGRRLEIEPRSKDEGYRDLPGTDGRTMYLPESVTLFPGRDQNFSFYKVALLHQLGFFEFGTFDSIGEANRAVRSFSDVALARVIFRILEDARIDWRLECKFRGTVVAMKEQKNDALERRDLIPRGRQSQLLEILIQRTLDGPIPGWVDPQWRGDAERLVALLDGLSAPAASVQDSLALISPCFDILHDDAEPGLAAQPMMTMPVVVAYRGESDTDRVMINLALLDLQESLEAEEDDTMSIASLADPRNAEIVEIVKGDLQDSAGMLMTDLDIDLDDAEHVDGDEREELARKFEESLKGISNQGRDNQVYRYDEWDYIIDDYRRRWCTLHEIREVEEDPGYVDETLREHRSVARSVRRQLNMLRPELLRKIKGVMDGDELDLERAVEAVVDRRSGVTPDERIYVQRQRKDRDVAALFLLDMSASTDDVIAEAPDEEDAGDPASAGVGPAAPKRIIDLEKQSVVLMSDALEELGDNYSVCGFSGYGREQVDYFLCKDFGDPLDFRAKGRIGGIKPCRSTRMGPAIRHATRSLLRTECRIKALIIISDGYPQDYDYGKNRNSKEYGIMDTMKALSESRQQGVQSFCLTVDPSGHDYLREMCQDAQYMVIQDIRQLPNELSKVYRSLTG